MKHHTAITIRVGITWIEQHGPVEFDEGRFKLSQIFQGIGESVVKYRVIGFYPDGRFIQLRNLEEILFHRCDFGENKDGFDMSRMNRQPLLYGTFCLGHLALIQ